MVLKDLYDKIWLWGAEVGSSYVTCELGYFVAPCPKFVDLYDLSGQQLIVSVKINDDIVKSNLNTKGFNLMFLKK